MKFIVTLEWDDEKYGKIWSKTEKVFINELSADMQEHFFHEMLLSGRFPTTRFCNAITKLYSHAG